MKLILKIIITNFLIVGFGYANDIRVFDFTQKELSQLDVRKVRGADNETIYTVGSNENGNFLKGKTFIKNVQESYIRSEGRLIVGAGFKNLIILFYLSDFI